MRVRWAWSAVCGVLAAAMLSGGLACSSGHHTSAGGQGQRTRVPAPGQRSVIPAPVPIGPGGGGLARIGQITPDSGPGGTRVTISGANLGGRTIVCFGTWAATGGQVSGEGRQLTVTAPAGTGTVPVFVLNKAGKSGTASFTFTGSASASAVLVPACAGTGAASATASPRPSP
jgi:hypothetical protein